MSKTFKEAVGQVIAEGKYGTDKDCGHLSKIPRPHVYGELYELLFKANLDSQPCSHVMEVGVNSGGSIKALSYRFPEATVHGVDIIKQATWDDLSCEPNIKLYNANAYISTFVDRFGDGQFDLILDDGPHTAESQLDFLKLYTSKVREGGLLLIEDIASHEIAISLHRLAESLGLCKLNFIVDRTVVNPWGFDEINLVCIK